MLKSSVIICGQKQQDIKPINLCTAKHDTMKLMPLFLGEIQTKNAPLKIKPSVYLREMTMSTDERIEQLSKLTKITFGYTSLIMNTQNTFRINPPIIIFQSFLPGKQYTATLTISNVSESLKQVSLKSQPSAVFSVSHLSKVRSKLAPGISVHFLVRFSPQTNEDCSHALVVETENDSFEVPILAMGSRPLINFPDVINLNESLVRVHSSKSFYVKNFGEVPAAFSMVCEKPFSVSPEKCIVNVGKMAMITIKFEPDIVNDFFKQLVVQFESGEKVYIELTGFSKNGRIWLDTNSVTLENTFIGLKRHHQVTLYNDTESVIEFSWHKMESAHQDWDNLERMKERFGNVKMNETIRSTKLEYNKIIFEDDQAQVYSRILKDETSLLSTGDLLFSNKHFEISPLEGDVWPGGKIVMTVNFSPSSSGLFSCSGFCDVTGRVNRLPLHLSGQGLGPIIKLSLRSLDIGEVFLGSTQAYEIIAANKGDIPGLIKYIPSTSTFGGSLTCAPESHCLMPYEMKPFIISFHRSRTGTFVEDLSFKVAHSEEQLKICIKGRIVNPTISFDSMKIDFGCVAIGFSKTQMVNLVNESQVPVTFALRVPADGKVPPISFESFAAAPTKLALSAYCKEFTIIPDSGVIEPNSSVPIKVTLLTNTIKRNCCALVAENKNSKLSESVSLTIIYDAQVASLVCYPSELTLRFCFIHHEYTLELTVTNASELPTYFYLPPQNVSSPPPRINYKMNIFEQFLEPNESVLVTVNVTPIMVGRVSEDVKVLILGKGVVTTLCSIYCCAQGPNVSASVEALNFGKMTLMESKTLSLELSNDSPISALFFASVEEKLQTKWEVEPETGYLEPGQSTRINVTLTVVDPGNISSTLLLQVENGRSITVELFASASGCGIITDPKIFPQINLGFLFSRRQYQFTVRLFNPGARHHLIQFTAEKISLRHGTTVQLCYQDRVYTTAVKIWPFSEQSLENPKIIPLSVISECFLVMDGSFLNLFKFTPHKFELDGGQKTEIILEAQSNREIEVSEDFICWAVINKRGIKQNLGNIRIKASFIAPMIELSQDVLDFEINIGPEDSQGQISIKILKLKSIANLPVTLVLELNSPFMILEEEDERFTESLVCLKPEEEAEVRIAFQPPIQDNLQCTAYSDTLHIRYQEHPQKDKVLLKGKLNFPNLQLSHHNLDFRCIPVDFQDHKEIIMVNPTPLPVTFNFAWDSDSIVTSYFEQEKIEDILGAELPENLKLDPLYYNRQILEMEDKESSVGFVPLIYVEPVPVSPTMFQRWQKYETDLEEDDGKQMHDLLFPVIQSYFSPEHPSPEFVDLPSESLSSSVVSQVLDLTPMFGTLAPFQSQVLNVSFQPKAFMGIAANLVGSVQGGPTVTIRLAGQSSRHLFCLSTTFINFGFRSFLETCEEVIKLTNMSQLPFRFKVSSPSTLLNTNVDEVEVGKITVKPSFGEVLSQSSAAISVKFYPGLSGEFQQLFTIQVGYIEPVNVLVTGYGVLPQISVSLYRISRPRIPLAWMYEAVAGLTAYRFHHLISGQNTPDVSFNNELLEDWVVINYSDKFPTNDDIWLAVERVIAHNFVKGNAMCLTQTGRYGSRSPYSQLVLPGYILDFGSVVVGTTTEATVLVENRGLVPADVSSFLSVSEKKLKQDGFLISFQNQLGLPVGRTVPLYITFKPTFERHSYKEEMVHFVINLQISNGPTLPIYTKALLTVPYITVDQKLIDFGYVECGHCRKMCLLIKNSGVVEAEWTATLVKTKRQKSHGKAVLDQEIAFFLSQKSALFPSKSAELLYIGFFPKEEKLFETILRLEVKNNPEKVNVRLNGCGVEPRIEITPETVNFESHIPYSGSIEKIFTVTNKSPNIVELYFPDYDSDIIEEDRMLRVLTHLYHSDKMLLPLDLYNTKPRSTLKEFYDEFILNAQTLLRNASLTTKSSAVCGTKSSTNIFLHSLESTSEVLQNAVLHSSIDKAFPEPFASLSNTDIENSLHEVISTYFKESNLDPLGLKTRTVPQPSFTPLPLEQNKAILLVFHGAPKTDYLHWASRTARKLNLSVKTLDQLILEEAAMSLKMAAIQVQEAITNAYMNQAMEEEAMERLSNCGPGVSFEELCERVKFLSTPKDQGTAKEKAKTGAKAGKTSPKSGASKPGTASKSGTAKKDVSTTFSDIPVELFVELIRDRLLEEVANGLVLEALTGFFLKSVSSAVQVILRCVGHISCLEFISVFNTLEQHLLWERKCYLKQVLKQKAIDEKKMQQFDQLSSEAIEELPVEDRNLYENTVLLERKQMLSLAKARRNELNPILSLSPTMKSKKEGRKKSIGETNKTKESKKTSNSKETKKTVKSKKKESTIEASKQKKISGSSIKSLSKKKSLKKREVLKDNNVLLEAAFSHYQSELEELVTILSRWDKTTKEFLDKDRPSSLFNLPKPQSRKGKHPLNKSTHNEDQKGQRESIGINTNIVTLPLNPRDVWFNDLIKHFSTTPAFTQSLKIEKEWWDIVIPQPLDLAYISKPELRIQQQLLEPFHILNSKYTRDEKEVKKQHFTSSENHDVEEDFVTGEKSKQERNENEEEEEPIRSISGSNESDSLDGNLQHTPSVWTSSELDGIKSDSLGSRKHSTVMSKDSTSKTESTGKSSELSGSELSVVSGEEERFTARVELAPGEQKSWKVVFKPESVSSFLKTIQLEVGGIRRKYKVDLEAVCDIPRVNCNPSVMFEKVHETLKSSCISQCVYLNDDKLFYFGPVFATAANEFRTNDLATNFYFTNISTVEAEIEFSFLSSAEVSEHAFGFTPKSLIIAPAETKALEVFGCPRTIGKYMETLICSIKNNPEPIFIQMSCIGIKPEFEFEPKVVKFERVLLYRKEFCQLNITNKCYKCLGWRLVDTSQLGEQISISQQSGVIPALQTACVNIYFDAQKVEVASHIMYIQVYDDQFRGEAFYSEPVEVILESVDVLVDIDFPETKSPEVKFVSVRVGEPETQTVVLRNKGKYDVKFQVKFNEEVKTDFDPELLFSFSPRSGVLPKLEKPVPVKIICLCTHPIHVVKLPLFKVWLVDTGPQEQSVAAIPIPVSVEANSSQYKVIPESELNFGPMLVGSTKTEPITIQNTGQFEFAFHILTLEEAQQEKVGENQQEQIKSNKSLKGKSNKSNQGSSKTKPGKSTNLGKRGDEWPSLTAGVFTLSKSGGLVAPGTSCVVDVECTAFSESKSSQVIVIKLLDYPWNKKKGTHINLTAASYLPFINFDDLHYIFQEAIQNSSEAAQKHGEPVTVYSREKNELLFANVCVGEETSLNLYLHLHNSGLVPCEATASLLQKSIYFLLDPTKFQIMPYEKLKLKVSFTPDQIGTVTDTLQLEIALPSPLGSQKFTTTLVGEAHLPQIHVTRPPSLLGQPTLQFPPTLIGDSCEERLVFVNSGNINCTVIVEIIRNTDNTFSFSLVTPISSSAAEKSHHIVKLAKGCLCEMSVKFQPQKPGIISAQVKLYITNNPYDDHTVTVQGVGFMQNVVLEGLPLFDDQKHSVVGENSDALRLKYILDYGECGVGQVARKVFCLKNQTPDLWYRFVWADLSSVTISPSTGHLPPQSSKEIRVNFTCEHPPVHWEKEEIICTLTQIQLKVEDGPLVGWDNHQKTVMWVECSDESAMAGAKKKLCSIDEPEFDEIPGSNLSLAVLINVSADFARIACLPDAIIFPSTIIHQVEEQILELSNPGIVPAVFFWTVTDQFQSCVEDSMKASYGAVTMSAERPKLKFCGVNKNQHLVKRPATCPLTVPGPIPSSVELISRDDSKIETSLQQPKPELKSFCWPIIVEPSAGKILPGNQTFCKVKFQPREMSFFRSNLRLNLKNKEPGTKEVLLRVEGSSMLPCCHLVVPDCTPSSYPDSLQIHFKVLGTRKPVYKVVNVVNTTDEDYSFEWRDLSQGKLSAFSCSTTFSRLNASKYLEVLFSFIPKEAGIYNSTWQLSIPERQIKQDVQLIGFATEPAVCLLPTFLSLRPTLIGVKSEGKVSLVNHEDRDLRYNVDTDSLHCGTWAQTLQVWPMKGVVPAQSQVDLRVWVLPTQSGEGQFQPKVFVQLLKAGLTMDVTTLCFQVQPLLVYQDSNKASHHISSDKSSEINVGVLESRIPFAVTFTLTNIGKPAFHYQWIWDPATWLEAGVSLSVATTTGMVGPQAKHPLTLQLTPLARTVFSQLKLQLAISKGPTFDLLFRGSAAQPMFKFSFNHYDFGPCFVQLSDIEHNKTNLVFTNTDENSLLLEAEFEPKPHLKVKLTQAIVAPRSELSVPITFLPRARETYCEILTLLVNSNHQHRVTLTGRGTEFNVSLVNPLDKFISLEGVMVGKRKKKCVEVVNQSEKSVCPLFFLEPEASEVSLVPVELVTLKVNQSTTLTVTFSPATVAKAIDQELCMKFQEHKIVLSSLKASSVGVSIILDRDYIPFGSTIIGNTATSKLLLSNNGDLAVKFLWTVNNEVFSISPTEGYITPGTEVILTVFYTPKKLKEDSSCRAVCNLTNHKQLMVTLTGSCVDIPPSTQTIHLSCPVRQTKSTQIPIFNKYGQDVTLSAVISGEYFYGDHVASIPPFGTHMFEITYSPMAISPTHVHKGTAIFNLEDGTCMVYSLEGKAGPPSMAERLHAEMFTHTPHTLQIPVHNWLQVPQKFLVTHSIESSSVAGLNMTVTHNEYFLLSGRQTRALPLNLVSHHPGNITVKVALTNESTTEYEWFEAVCDVKPCPSLRDIHLSSRVREPAYYNLEVYNPLETPVTVNCSNYVQELFVVNVPFTLEPLQTGIVTLEYLPLWTRDPTVHILELTCGDLGVFPYSMTLTALPSVPLPPLHISCQLGLATRSHLFIQNPIAQQTTFHCTSNHEDLSVESVVNVKSQECASVQLVYQPSSLSEFSAEIIASSSTAGDFMFSVIASCKMPEPRGPYTVSPGSNAKISIKNIFKETSTFTFSVDNPAFVLQETDATLEPNQEADVVVDMLDSDVKEFRQYPETGKLTVSVTEENLSHIKWTFYLRGLYPIESTATNPDQSV